MSAHAPLRVLAYKPSPARQTIAMEGLICCEPLELEYLDSALADEEVTLLDGMVDRRDPARVATVVDAQLVLITAFITNVVDVIALARRLKALPRPPLIFVGGPHAEVMPEHFHDAAIDAVFFADQLGALARVVKRVKAGAPYDDVPGVSARRGDAFVSTQGPPLEPARLGAPQRRALEEDPGRYFYLHYERCASVKTAFGCHEQCAFCFCTAMHGGRYGPRPLDGVLDEIAALPVDNVFVVDDNFLSTRRRVEEFCDGVAARGIDKRYIVYGDAAFIAQHPDLVERLRDVGLRGIIVGFEAVTDAELEAMNKRARVADNDRVVELCRALDLDLFALFMVDPDWTPAAFRHLADYVKDRALAFATFATHTLFPGTALAEGVDFTAERDWWRYDLLRLHRRPRHMSSWRYYLWLLYLYLLPSMYGPTRRALRRRMGTRRLWAMSLRSTWVGLGFLIKLLRWR